MKTFALIGAGRAGGTLAWALSRSDYRLVACFCSTPRRTREAVKFLGAGRAAISLADAASAAPLTIIAIPDRLLEGVAAELAGADMHGRSLLHLSGAQSADALAAARAGGASVAACHPLTSLARRSHDADAFRGVAFAVDGDAAAVRAAKALARAVGGRPFLAAPAGRVSYHAGAVLASNALVTLLDLACGLVRPVGLDDKQALRALLPLVRATLANVEEVGLEAALTGPVRRGDASTLARHLAALPRGPEREAYVTLARLSLDLARCAGLDDERAAAVEAVLAGASMAFHVVLSLAPESMPAALSADLAGADLVEYRLEALHEPDLAALYACGRTPAIATCRPLTRARSEADRAHLLAAAVAAGARYVDVEWESFADGLGRDFPRDRLILSHHGGGDLEALADAMAAARPAVVKLVPEATGPGDLPRLRELVARLRAHEVEACVFASGEKGTATRVLTRLWGGFASYVAAERGHETAPGQLTLAELTATYRIGSLAATSFVAGVAGWPLAHSASPATHNAWYRSLGLDGVYLPFATDDARALIAAARSEGFRGLSITRPLKQAVMPLVDRIGESARAAGAANTIVRDADGRLRAENTDGIAVCEALVAAGLTLAGARVLVLGAGGAARAAAAALAGAGAAVTIANRTPARAERAAAELGIAWTAWEALPAWDVLVQATPAADVPLPPRGVGGRALVEFVYAPRQTRMVREATEQGLLVVDGCQIFQRQAAHQLFLMTGVRPDGSA